MHLFFFDQHAHRHINGSPIWWVTATSRCAMFKWTMEFLRTGTFCPRSRELPQVNEYPTAWLKTTVCYFMWNSYLYLTWAKINDFEWINWYSLHVKKSIVWFSRTNYVINTLWVIKKDFLFTHVFVEILLFYNYLSSICAAPSIG